MYGGGGIVLTAHMMKPITICHRCQVFDWPIKLYNSQVHRTPHCQSQMPFLWQQTIEQRRFLLSYTVGQNQQSVGGRTCGIILCIGVSSVVHLLNLLSPVNNSSSIAFCHAVWMAMQQLYIIICNLMFAWAVVWCGWMMCGYYCSNTPCSPHTAVLPTTEQQQAQHHVLYTSLSALYSLIDYSILHSKCALSSVSPTNSSQQFTTF